MVCPRGSEGVLSPRESREWGPGKVRNPADRSVQSFVAAVKTQADPAAAQFNKYSSHRDETFNPFSFADSSFTGFR